MSDLSATFDLLRTFPAALRRLAGAASPLLDWRPGSWDGIPSEMLTVRQQICHVRDIEIDGYQVRFERVLRERQPHLPSVDTYGLIATRHYDEADVHVTLAEFDTARAATLRALAAVALHDLERTAVFDDYGLVTLRGLVHFLASHDQQHLAGIQWLMGQHAGTFARR